MRLYAFNKLEEKLTQLGYPQMKESGFKVIKVDLTQEEISGHISYRQDGVYRTINNQAQRGYMYMYSYDVAKHNQYPKFHIMKCKTIVDQMSRGAFNTKYIWSNSNVVDVQERTTRDVYHDVRLSLCGNCAKEAVGTIERTTEEFYQMLLANAALTIDVSLDKRPYNSGEISKIFREMMNYTCNACSLKITDRMDRVYMHMHHKDHNPLNNYPENLESLCYLCHIHTDALHKAKLNKPRIKQSLDYFVNKYKEELVKIGNPYIKAYLTQL
ncbi:hypothetical protein LX64_04894 [Chitinophaga skermanii]|uniref:HNH nuclease domain-containing protein n=1 Tax=Chitinophaga skermanii TaxID=331697 RepID=A0A327Q7U4_9BACT|nr:HNH endonuclease [Chitinophaga skermanii]RAI97846.1 hypothetical protein LX64_04894 [Chitinophaga skermanii]